MTTITLLGLGEVGRVLAEELAATATVGAWDTAFADPGGRASTNRDQLCLPVTASAADAVGGADVVFSAVTAANSLAAAESVRSGLPAGTWYVDLNSSSPGQKQAAAEVIDHAGGRYVEAAVMSPIEPKRLAAPILLGGPSSADFAPIAAGLGFSAAEVYAETVGPAAATKLCRSVVVKGLEALLTEAMLAARPWGVEQRVLDSLSNMVPAADWTALAGYMVSRSLEHGARRAEEMREAARTVAETGVTPWMAEATAERQAWASSFGAASAPGDLTAMIDALRADLTERTPAVIIDCHGHYTTAPQAHSDWRDAQIAAFDAGLPAPQYPSISDDEIRDTVERNQLRLLRERGADMTIFSPRASTMAHHVGDEAVSRAWTVACNDLIKRVVDLYPDTFIGVCQLPQSPGVPIEHSIAELERCVTELGFVGCNLNPDPSGGHWTAEPLTDKSWYPFYEKMVELDVPAMVHVSGSANANFHATGAHYMNADTTAFMQLLQGDLFADFPDLRFVIPHGGGAVPYHWGRYRGLADMLKKPPLSEHVMGNVFFDTCVYHQPGINLLFEVIDVDNILFGSEMVGAVRGLDPVTGNYFDDTKRYVDALGLDAADRAKVYEGNARRVYPRLDAGLTAKGL